MLESVISKRNGGGGGAEPGAWGEAPPGADGAKPPTRRQRLGDRSAPLAAGW